MPQSAYRPSRICRLEPLEQRTVLDSTVVFNEIMYNPTGSDDGLEWVELHNQMGVDMDISGWRLEAGPQFEFPEGTIVPGNGYLIVAADPEVLRAVNGTLGVLGPWEGSLANSAQELFLKNNSGRVMDSVHYTDSDPWPVGADGGGVSLAKRSPMLSSESATNWTMSPEVGGTAGRENFPGSPSTKPTDLMALAGGVILNEISAAGRAGFQVELYNLGPDAVDLEGATIVSSDGRYDPFRFSPRTLAGGEFLVLSGSALGFGTEPGDRLYVYGPGGGQLYDAQQVTDRLQGRSPLHGGRWLYPDRPTFGSANHFDFHDEIVIHEIMYHPRSAVGNLSDESADEWLELHNRSDTDAIDLSGWSFADGIDFEFPAGLQLGPQEYLVVARDPDWLLGSRPGLDPSRVVGPYAGALSDRGERIELRDAFGNPADEAAYHEQGRWAADADGLGSSLELRDAAADNSRPEAWAASDEASQSLWQSYSYSGLGTNLPNDPTRYNELVLGLLDAGEILLDALSVIEEKGTPAERQLLQNGTFQSDPVGESPAAWRILGTHHGQVIRDPDDPANQVLYLWASGPTEHMHNHAETTLKDGEQLVTIDPNKNYEISFRARWLSGSNQLHTRLYFNRLARTTELAVPQWGGTPGQPNSQRVENLGPTFAGLRHAPLIPEADEPMTVSVVADDPDHVAAVALWYSVDDGPFVAQSMTAGAELGHYWAVIPGQAASSTIQFYIQATDGRGAESLFPAAGPASRALIKVQDGAAGSGPGHELRIIMTAADTDRLHDVTQVMSNDRLGATVVYNQQQVYYDVGVRLKGSERGRAQNVRVGFNIEFDPMQKFRGVHETVAIDRSGAGDQFSQKEILIKHAINHAGNIPGSYDDLIYLIAPRSVHSGSAMLSMARFNDVFLDSQYADGSRGTAFEYELIYYPTSTVGGDVEGLKLPNPDDVAGVRMMNLGDNKEAYRWHWLIKNNRQEDDYSRLIAAVSALGLPVGESFQRETQAVLDVDQWLRAFAVQVLFGIGDNYATGAQHNAILYTRPEDGKTLYLPWDMDFTFSESAGSSPTPNSDLQKLLMDPGNKHAYYGHLHDIVTTTFNPQYMQRWMEHYSTFLPTEDLTQFAFYFPLRRDSLERRFPAWTPFQITSEQPLDVGGAETVRLEGNGWIDVREIRLSGSDHPLDVIWTGETQWQAHVPLDRRTTRIKLEAYDMQGNRVGSDSLAVSSSAGDETITSLKISEIHFHPSEPTSAELLGNPGLTSEDFEFIELTNAGDEPISLEGLRFVQGIDAALAPATVAPGAFALVVRNPQAFELRYGLGHQIVGQFPHEFLRDSGERIAIEDARGVTIADFAYGDDDPWPRRADGDGSSLEWTALAADSARAENWRASSAIGGTPGAGAADQPSAVVVNEILARGGGPDRMELFNTGGTAVDLSGWLLSDDAQDLFKYRFAMDTLLAPRARLVVDAGQFGFGLDGRNGDEVLLVETDPRDGRPLRFADHVVFGATPPDVSWGRWPDGDRSAALFPLSSQSFGGANGNPLRGDVILSEIQYGAGSLDWQLDFGADSLEGLQVDAGTWQIVDDRLHAEPGSDADALAVVPSFKSGPVPFSVKTIVRFPSESQFNTNAVIVFDYRGPDDFKFASVHARAGHWRMGRKVGDQWEFLAQTVQPVRADADHQLEVRIDGGQAVLSARGVSMVRYDFAEPLHDGLVGVGTRGGEALFDDVSFRMDDAASFDFVELTNVSEHTVDLEGWELSGGVAFTFRSAAVLPAATTWVVVSFDPEDSTRAAAFREAYGIGVGVTLVGPFTRQLDHQGDGIAISRPDEPVSPRAARLLVDRVVYDDAQPWPHAASGSGKSLHRARDDVFGELAMSWRAAEPSPGITGFVSRGDMNLDGRIDELDLTALAIALRDAGAYETLYGVSAAVAGDLDRDGDLDFDDIDEWGALTRR